jgi:hypothetical protein
MSGNHKCLTLCMPHLASYEARLSIEFLYICISIGGCAKHTHNHLNEALSYPYVSSLLLV